MCECDRADAYFETWRRARKPHVCWECGDTISVGTDYRYLSGVWNGRGASFHVCASCVAVRQFYEDTLTRHDCPPCIGQLWDDVLADSEMTRDEWIEEAAKCSA